VVTSALESGELAAVNLISEYAMEQNQLLAAIPLADSTGEIHAMLVVRSMPFFAFQENNLRLIAVLVAHGVDHLRFGTADSSTGRFIASFERVHQDFLRFKLDATLLRLSGAPGDVLNVYGQLRSSVRAVDLMCMAKDEEKPVIWLLLPLTDTANAQAWMQRVDDILGRVTSELIAINDIDPRTIRSLEPH
jgi:hypothetical protein